jgi:hypothetical protein
MNIKLLRFTITAVSLLILAFGPNLRAESDVAKPPPPTATGAPNGLLTQAYIILSQSNRDYKGHRVKAMKHLEAAAKELGFTLQGDGLGKKQQIISDQQLQVAQRDLQQALPGLPPKAKTHVEKAVKEISTALSIK